MEKRGIILVDFPFTDTYGSKIRPALILAVEDHNITMAFITTVLPEKYESDVSIKRTAANGLKKDSIIRLNKMITLDAKLIMGEIGNISQNEIKIINKKLIKLFQLDVQLILKSN